VAELLVARPARCARAVEPDSPHCEQGGRSLREGRLVIANHLPGLSWPHCKQQASSESAAT